MAASTLAPAPADPDRVREGLRPDRGADLGERIRPIASPSADDGGAPGPPGCRLWRERPAARDPQEVVHPDAHRLIVVRQGGVVVHGIADGPKVLQPRDALLVPPGTRHTVTALTDNADLVVLEYRERTPEGVWSTRGRRRGGFVRAESIRPLRERFPVRFAPAIHDVLSPRTLLPLVGPIAFGPGRFAIRGPEGLVVAMVTTPPGTGPALHVHTQSTEIFVVLEGRFRVYWGEEGEHEALLDAADAVVIPPGFNRAFEATGDGPHWLLPIVVGANDETEDIAWLPAVERALRAAASPWQVAVALHTRLRIASRRSA